MAPRMFWRITDDLCWFYMLLWAGRNLRIVLMFSIFRGECLICRHLQPCQISRHGCATRSSLASSSRCAIFWTAGHLTDTSFLLLLLFFSACMSGTAASPGTGTSGRGEDVSSSRGEDVSSSRGEDVSSSRGDDVASVMVMLGHAWFRLAMIQDPRAELPPTL